MKKEYYLKLVDIMQGISQSKIWESSRLSGNDYTKSVIAAQAGVNLIRHCQQLRRLTGQRDLTASLDLSVSNLGRKLEIKIKNITN